MVLFQNAQSHYNTPSRVSISDRTNCRLCLFLSYVTKHKAVSVMMDIQLLVKYADFVMTLSARGPSLYVRI